MPSGMDEYAFALDQLRILAQQDLADWWANTDGLAPPVRMDTLREAFHAIQATYGEQAAYLAADYLFLQRSLDDTLSELEFPEVSNPAGYEQARAGFNWATAKYREEFAPELVPMAREKLAGVLNRLVSQPAHDTVAKAVETAGTGYARVPEPGACSFCLMLASRGAAYSKASVQSANGYHDNCRCVGVEVKSDADLPRINRELHELWQATGKKLGETPTDRQFQEALLRYRNRTPDWVPFEAIRIKEKPQHQRGMHPGVKTIPDLEKHALVESVSTLPGTKRSKREQQVYENEQSVIEWLAGNGAVKIQRVGIANDAIPSLPEGQKKTPDLIVDGMTADVKTITSKRGIHKNAKRGSQQSTLLIYDARKSGIDEKDLVTSSKNAIRDYGDRLDRIVIISDKTTLFWER
ncbi:hypothetical protein CHU72_08470 [Corynebacterium sp. LK12]|nr:hypothetical protein CHU72_08470 [Corynebacterium sp. LK12]